MLAHWTEIFFITSIHYLTLFYYHSCVFVQGPKCRTNGSRQSEATNVSFTKIKVTVVNKVSRQQNMSEQAGNHENYKKKLNGKANWNDSIMRQATKADDLATEWGKTHGLNSQEAYSLVKHRWHRKQVGKHTKAWDMRRVTFKMKQGITVSLLQRTTSRCSFQNKKIFELHWVGGDGRLDDWGRTCRGKGWRGGMTFPLAGCCGGWEEVQDH